MIVIPVTITTELIEHADGRPVAYVDATSLAVFAYQKPDGSYVIDISTRDDIPLEQLDVLLDGSSLLRLWQPVSCCCRPRSVDTSS
jgi:hypothetical protein